eukprot:g4410.t1
MEQELIDSDVKLDLLNVKHRLRNLSIEEDKKVNDIHHDKKWQAENAIKLFMRNLTSRNIGIGQLFASMENAYSYEMSGKMFNLNTTNVNNFTHKTFGAFLHGVKFYQICPYNTTTNTTLRNIFDAIDANRDGFISWSEMKTAYNFYLDEENSLNKKKLKRNDHWNDDGTSGYTYILSKQKRVYKAKRSPASSLGDEDKNQREATQNVFLPFQIIFLIWSPSLLAALSSDPRNEFRPGIAVEFYRECSPGKHFVDSADTFIYDEPDLIRTEKNVDFHSCTDKSENPENPEPNPEPNPNPEEKTEKCEPSNWNLPFQDEFKLRLTGFLDIGKSGSGRYEFELLSDDDSKLFLKKGMEETLHVHRTWQNWDQEVNQGSVEVMLNPQDKTQMGKGPPKFGMLPIKITYFKDTGDSRLRFRYKTPVSADFLVVPEGKLFHIGETGELEPGLRADYYRSCRSVSDSKQLWLDSRIPIVTGELDDINIPIDYKNEDNKWCNLLKMDEMKGKKMDPCRYDLTDYFSARFEGYLKVSAPGLWSFGLQANDGGNFYLDLPNHKNATMSNPILTMEKSQWYGQEITVEIDITQKDCNDAWFLRENSTSSSIEEKNVTLPCIFPYRLDYYENDYYSGVVLKWDNKNETSHQADDANTLDGMGLAPIPKSAFYLIGEVPEEDQTELKEGIISCEDVKNPNTVANGVCDVENNVPNCWDGGDCCESTCISGQQYPCGTILDKNPFCLFGEELCKWNNCHGPTDSGLDAELFLLPPDMQQGGLLSDPFNTEPIAETTVDSLFFPKTFDVFRGFEKANKTMFASPSQGWNHFAIRFSGFFLLKNRGWFTFYMASDDGSVLYINDKIVISNDGLHWTEEKSARVWLTEGFHSIYVEYYELYPPHALMIQMEGPPTLENSHKAPLSSQMLFNSNPCKDEDLTEEEWIQTRKTNPMCNSHGTCNVVCDFEHGACAGAKCECEAPFYGAFCHAKTNESNVGTAIFMILLLLFTCISAIVVYYKRKLVREWLIDKLVLQRERDRHHDLMRRNRVINLEDDDEDENRLEIIPRMEQSVSTNSNEVALEPMGEEI